MQRARASQNHQRDLPKEKDKGHQEKSTATGSTRACASTRVASSHIFAANATRKDTTP
jgi:hypothetical protein